MVKKVSKPTAAKAKKANWWAVAGGLLGVLGLIVVYLGKKKDRFAMFYAKQSAIINILGIVLSPFTGGLLGAIAGLAAIWLAYKAYLGEWYRFPQVADWADQIKI